MSEKKDQEKLMDPDDILFSMPTIEDNEILDAAEELVLRGLGVEGKGEDG